MSYAPPGESAVILLTERITLDGAMITGILYGIHLMLSGMCLRLLWKQRTKMFDQNWFFVGYIMTLFILGTLYVISDFRVTQLMFVDERNFPGGPIGWEAAEYSLAINTLGNVSYTMTNWFADGLLLWRATVIWKGSCLCPIVLFIPFLMYCCSFVTSILSLVQTGEPANSIWTSFNITLPYFIISLALNIIVTVLIVLRLLLQRKRILRAIGGQNGNGSQYISVAAMIIESAALYSTFSLCFLVPYIVNHPIQQAFLQFLSQIQIIGPLLIIYRVALGRAWTARTEGALSRTIEDQQKNPALVSNESPPAVIDVTDSSRISTQMIELKILENGYTSGKECDSTNVDSWIEGGCI